MKIVITFCLLLSCNIALLSSESGSEAYEAGRLTSRRLESLGDFDGVDLDRNELSRDFVQRQEFDWLKKQVQENEKRIAALEGFSEWYCNEELTKEIRQRRIATGIAVIVPVVTVAAYLLGKKQK